MPELGIVVSCWLDSEMGEFDCYFASFGNEMPEGKPSERPPILRYLARNFRVLAD